MFLSQIQHSGENDMKETLLRLWSDDEGQDLVEYALLCALISVALIAAMQALKGGVSTAFSEAVSGLNQ